MYDVDKRQTKLLLPALSSAGSFFGLLILTITTNPVQNIALAIVFFGGLLILLLSFGHLIVGWHSGQVSSKNRYRIFISSVFLLILLMFKSAQSLSWVDTLVLVLIIIGLVFYSGRRS